MIISGGLNVYPKEVEDKIDQLDLVKEVAIIGKIKAFANQYFILQAFHMQTLARPSLLSAFQNLTQHPKDWRKDSKPK
jgi:acyl-CoA synthetase (AMP-forming)/AMP-acid ligase II